MTYPADRGLGPEDAAVGPTKTAVTSAKARPDGRELEHFSNQLYWSRAEHYRTYPSNSPTRPSYPAVPFASPCGGVEVDPPRSLGPTRLKDSVVTARAGAENVLAAMKPRRWFHCTHIYHWCARRGGGCVKGEVST